MLESEGRGRDGGAEQRSVKRLSARREQAKRGARTLEQHSKRFPTVSSEFGLLPRLLSGRGAGTAQTSALG